MLHPRLRSVPIKRFLNKPSWHSPVPANEQVTLAAAVRQSARQLIYKRCPKVVLMRMAGESV